MRWNNRYLVIISVLFTLICMEIGARMWNNDPLLSTDNFLVLIRDLSTSAYPAQYHEVLGWVPKADYDSSDNKWRTRVTTDAQGLRVNGNEPPAPGAAEPLHVLAVGDSFTFGDEVSNNETWPAVLERMSGARVSNAGVFGYGFDQTVLRAEELTPLLKPDILVVGVVTSDIDRCELSMRMGVSKPYFRVQGQELVLMNVPPARPDTELEGVRRILGYSRLAYEVCYKLAPSWLLSGCWREERAHDQGAEVACLLAERVARLADTGARPVLFLEYWDDALERTPGFDRMISCAQAQGVQVVDLLPALERVREQDPHRFEDFYDGHMTPEGNEFAAQVLAQELGLTHGADQP